jgi:hypothetical protein
MKCTLVWIAGREAEQLRAEIEERWPPEGIRSRLMARQAARKEEDSERQ